jgi:hypothetical protein
MNTMYPFRWFADAGDATGDVSTQHTNPSYPSTAWEPGDGATGAAEGIGIFPAYVNAALMNPGSQAPVSGSPATMNGPQQGPVAYSSYAAALPSHYLSNQPPWKSAPMQAASGGPGHGPAAQAPSGPSAATSGGCSGCSGDCKNKACGHMSPAIGLDSANDFPPLYSQPTVSQTQVADSSLWHGVSDHRPAWGASHGAQADTTVPIQGQ